MEPQTPPANTSDPFTMLFDAGSSPDLWLLIAGPAALLLFVIALYAVIVSVRNRRERRQLERAMQLEDKNDASISSLPDGEEPRTPPFEIPANLEGVPLEPNERLGTTEKGKPALKVIQGMAPKVAPAPAYPSDVADIRGTDRSTWLQRLRGGLSKSRDSLRSGMQSLFTGKARLDADTLERLHEVLYRADIGVSATDKLVDHVRRTLPKDEAADWESVQKALRECAQSLLVPAQAGPVSERPTGEPWVVLIVGVNGVGKTTTIGKLAAHFLAQDKTVLLAAADTFRAAAIEQLSVWGERLGVEVIKHKQGADPAAVAYDAVKAAKARKVDVLLIDTAGRLHSKSELMDELGKITRIIGRDLHGAPHETWLVIDATTGQNAIMQTKAFREVAGVSGLIVTKLDGTAKGGVLLAVTEQFKLPIRYIGVGEKASDLRAFEAGDFAETLF